MKVPFKLLPGGKAPTKATPGAAAFDLYARVDPELVQSEGVGSHERPGEIHIPYAQVQRPDPYDLNFLVAAAEVVKIPLGVRFAIPPGYYGQLCSRSSGGARGLIIPNGVGVIDSDYRGEVMAMFMNLSGEDIVIKDGDRIAQLLVLPVPAVTLVEGELEATARGANGFGSTGL